MSKDRQPWPMKWIALAILLAIVPYTIVTLKFRKEQPAFQPYEDMKNRANVARLLAAGYQRLPLTVQRPADGQHAPGGAEVGTSAGGIPAELRATLVEPPALPQEITSVSAAPTGNQLFPYLVQFTCELATEKQHLAGADLYVKDNALVLVPTFEPVGGDLATRSRYPVVLVTVPAGALKPGEYRFTLAAERASRTWPVEIR
jgi:hypothetical protein